MTEVFDEASRVDYAGGSYGGFWRMQERGRLVTRPDGGDLRKWSSFWPGDWKRKHIESATAEAWQHAKANGRLDAYGFTGIGGGFRVRGWLDMQGLIAVAYPSFWPPVVEVGPVGTIVRSVTAVERTFLSVDVPTSYNVLGIMLSLDFAGTLVSPYTDVRELARRGVEEPFVGGESTDSFSVEVDGEHATIESLYRDDLTLELPTRELLTALDEFAAWAG